MKFPALVCKLAHQINGEKVKNCPTTVDIEKIDINKSYRIFQRYIVMTVNKWIVLLNHLNNTNESLNENKIEDIINALDKKVVKLESGEKDTIKEIIEENDKSIWVDEIMKLSAFEGIDEIMVDEIIDSVIFKYNENINENKVEKIEKMLSDYDNVSKKLHQERNKENPDGDTLTELKNKKMDLRDKLAAVQLIFDKSEITKDKFEELKNKISSFKKK